jgi:hypothetical protein
VEGKGKARRKRRFHEPPPKRVQTGNIHSIFT